MGSAIDVKLQKQPHYRFPLSPPSSGTPTALSSPRSSPLTPKDPDALDKIFVSNPPFRRSTSQSSISWNQHDGNATDSDGGYITERTSPRLTIHRLPRKRNARALTLPAPSSSGKARAISPAHKTSGPLSRRSSNASSSSSSSSTHTSPEERTTIHPSASGIGRKVAASLQLFKETTAPTDEVNPAESSSRPEIPVSSSRRAGSSSKPDDVAEAQFEFVKRSEWPDREAAAVRRERSSTALERVRTRERPVSPQEMVSPRGKERTSSFREHIPNDLAHWRNEVMNRQENGRGRRRERLADDVFFQMDDDVGLDFPVSNSTTFHEHELPPSSPFDRPLSRAYFPPSPSPSRSPTNRISSSASSHNSSTGHSTRSSVFRHGVPDLTPIHTTQLHSRPTTPTQTTPTLAPIPLSPLDTTAFSPWSDDEWETASTATSTSTTSAQSSYPFHPIRNDDSGPPFVRAHYDHDDDDDEDEPPLHRYPPSSVISTDVDGPEDAEGSLDLDLDLSEEHLPHIPLRPFRNQVGGHSAIYKFTKRAVCKPLVSRENLFYESVEREAPPLLGFIPRYLGVMLVTYRRVPKGNTAPSSPLTNRMELPHPNRPPFRKAATDPTKKPSDLRISGSGIPSPLPEEEEGGDTDSDEAEMPEVLLDRNRHIIPEWMLRGGRNRSLSQSNAGVSRFPHRHIKRVQLDRGTASSPDLGTPTQVSTLHHARPSPLARYPPFVSSDVDAPTPVNSPSQTTYAFPSKLGEHPHPLNYLNHSISDEEDNFGRPTFRAFNSDQLPIQSPQSPGWFGGTGSTMVNTKLKDHVFSTVLRRFRRRTAGRWAAGTRTEDEGDVADAENDDVCRPHRRKGKLISQVDRLRHAETDGHEGSIRRVQSESMIASPEKLEALALEERRSKGIMDVFGMDYEHIPNDLKRSDAWRTVDLSPSISRRRSRSRSLDSHSVPPPLHAFNERVPIPEQNEPDPSITRQNHFILMEDLTGRLKHPCVMDLKMGTRQYGMDATSAKKKSQRKKCDRTTSRSLGVRVCGTQVWNRVTESYVTQDKYMGRDVRVEDFGSVLASFLSDGQKLLAYQIPSLLQKLYGLARIINRLKGYRFYGCSLLLIYEGDPAAQAAFKSCVLDNPSSRSKRGESLERQVSRAKMESNTDKPTLRRSHSEDLLIGPVAKRYSGRRKRGEVNVRIVDFAHTTTGKDWLPLPDSNDRTQVNEVTASSKGYQAEIDPETGLIYARFPPHYPDQPDRGFLFGLKNLTETLEQLWNDERLRRKKASRDDPSIVQLPPLLTDGKEIFEEIFGRSGEDEDLGMIST